MVTMSYKTELQASNIKKKLKISAQICLTQECWHYGPVDLAMAAQLHLCPYFNPDNTLIFNLGIFHVKHYNNIGDIALYFVL